VELGYVHSARDLALSECSCSARCVYAVCMGDAPRECFFSLFLHFGECALSVFLTFPWALGFVVVIVLDMLVAIN